MLEESLLGKKTEYLQTYTPSLLYPVPRTLARDKLSLPGALPFKGIDYWNCFEISWLNLKGKPEIALAELHFPFDTPNIVESKSLKLYFNSFNQSKFNSFETVRKTIEKDLNAACQGSIQVNLIQPSFFQLQTLSDFSGILLDNLDVDITEYDVQTKFLKNDVGYAEETLFSHLLKSNCLATGQPDWGSVLVRYKGPRINHEGLLKYIISFRNHSGFAEHCVEQMFCDILNNCKPEGLTVYARYTRRGGLDINPFRSNYEQPMLNARQPRQ